MRLEKRFNEEFDFMKDIRKAESKREWKERTGRIKEKIKPFFEISAYVGAAAGLAGGAAGAYLYAYCRGWEGAPYKLCSVETPPALAFSISLGVVGGVAAAAYVIVNLKEYFRKHKNINSNNNNLKIIQIQQ